jgi:hypothetical protein
VPHEPSSVFKGRQLNARLTIRFDHARQLKAAIMLQGLRHDPILRGRNASERYHTQIYRFECNVNPSNSSAH